MELARKEVFMMMDFTLLAGNKATNEIAMPSPKRNINYTSMTVSDEMVLYNDLNNRLMHLEKDLEIDPVVFQRIQEDTSKILFRWDEKEELLLRISWLSRLSAVQKEMADVTTYEQVRRLRFQLASCPTSPLKKQLQESLDELLVAFPQQEIEKTPEEIVMEFAVENAGDDFINLGKAGRKYVVNELLEKLGSNVPVDAIQEAVAQLEARVNRLIDLEDIETLDEQLRALPLPNYLALSNERAKLVGERLLEDKKWENLFTLHLLILRLDRKLRAEELEKEQNEMMKGIEDGIATVLDYKQAEKLGIQVF